MTDQRASADEQACREWWDGMNEEERLTILCLAKTNTVAEAWVSHKFKMIEDELLGDVSQL